jgi:hypothetical protein
LVESQTTGEREIIASVFALFPTSIEVEDRADFFGLGKYTIMS